MRQVQMVICRFALLLGTRHKPTVNADAEIFQKSSMFGQLVG